VGLYARLPRTGPRNGDTWVNRETAILFVTVSLVGCIGSPSQTISGQPTPTVSTSLSPTDSGPSTPPSAGFNGYGIAVVWFTGNEFQVNVTHSTCVTLAFNLTASGLAQSVNATLNLSLDEGLSGNMTGSVTPASAVFQPGNETIPGSTRLCAGSQLAAGSAVLALTTSPAVPVTRGSTRVEIT